MNTLRRKGNETAEKIRSRRLLVAGAVIVLALVTFGVLSLVQRFQSAGQHPNMTAINIMSAETQTAQAVLAAAGSQTPQPPDAATQVPQESATVAPAANTCTQTLSAGWPAQIQQYQPLIERAANATPDCIHPDAIAAVVTVASAGNPKYVNKAGGAGLCGLNPSTAGNTESQLMDPATNLNDCARMLADAMKKTKSQQYQDALVLFYSGGDPKYDAAAQALRDKVMAAWQSVVKK